MNVLIVALNSELERDVVVDIWETYKTDICVDGYCGVWILLTVQVRQWNGLHIFLLSRST